MKIPLVSGLFDDPATWPLDKWSAFFRTWLTFMTAENIGEARQKAGNLELQDMISVIEIFMMAMIYHDKTIDQPDQMVARREQLLKAVKGMEQYAKIIKMDRVDLFKYDKSTPTN